MSTRIARPKNDRLVAGVCAGLAQHLGLPVTAVRVAAVVGAVLSLGVTAGLYIVLWIALPRE